MTESTADPAVHRQNVPGFGSVAVRPLDPAADAGVVHRWVSQDRAAFWGMAGHSRRQVRDIYAYVDTLTTHHAYLVLRDGDPVGLFQTYQPEHDPVGACYDVLPGDFGIHLLIAPPGGRPRPGFTGTLLDVFLSYVFADPDHMRVVAEPDTRNEKSIARLLRGGFEPGPEIDLPGKRALLVFLTREAHVRRADRRDFWEEDSRPAP